MRKSDKVAARDAAELQAHLNDAWGQQFSRSGETYGRLFATVRDELTGFVQRRLDANMVTMREWSECRSFNDVLALQQRWMQAAVEQYVDEGSRIFETCRLAASDMADAASPAAEAMKPTAERRAASSRAIASEIKQAA
jgi:hypothetical protein